MSFECKNGSGCMYYKIDQNKQCTFCYQHVGIASSIVELHCRALSYCNHKRKGKIKRTSLIAYENLNIVKYSETLQQIALLDL